MQRRLTAFTTGTALLIAQTASAQAPPDAIPDEIVAPPSEALTLWEVLQSGGWAMYPLAALSLVGTMLVFAYFLSIRRGAVVTGNFMATTEALLRKRDFLGLLAVANRRSESAARVMQRALEFSSKHPNATFEEVREVAETEGTRQASLLNQRIAYLADIGAIAPMLGLLGTVFGMIQSFNALANDVATTRPMLLAEGVSQALVTTAAGLVIGIPAMAFYSFFRGQVQKLIAELEAASTILLAQLASAMNQRDKPKRSSSVDLGELVDDDDF